MKSSFLKENFDQKELIVTYKKERLECETCWMCKLQRDML